MSTQVGFYREWRDLMRSWGFTVLEAAGWETRDAEPRTTYLPGVLYIEHHDASTKLSGNWGALAYILANRLANIVTARDGQIMLCAAGVAWHAGVGGPMFDVPANGANPRSMGNEVCNSGFETYDPRCDRAIIAGEKAWCIVSARQAERVAGHKEWAKPPGRKQDPSIDMNQRRRDVAAFNPQGSQEEWDEMASKEEIKAAVRETVRAELDAFAKDLKRADVLHNRLAAVLENPGRKGGNSLASISAKLDAGDVSPPNG